MGPLEEGLGKGGAVRRVRVNTGGEMETSSITLQCSAHEESSDVDGSRR